MAIISELLSLNFPHIGEVQFVQSVRAKNIRISLKPFGKIRVTVPKKAKIEQAIAFVESKIDWIVRAQEQMAKKNQRTVFTPDTIFSIKNRKLQLLPWKSEQFRAQLSKDTLKIFYPQNIEIQSDKAQGIIRDYIVGALREEAKEYLPQRTEQLAAEHGFLYCGVAVKNISSRWGSCSAKNNINLNIHLIRLPQHLSDYVILHELNHTIHKNHGPFFWQNLNKITGGKAKQLDKEMKRYLVSGF